jgi:hypothetical protein
LVLLWQTVHRAVDGHAFPGNERFLHKVEMTVGLVVVVRAPVARRGRRHGVCGYNMGWVAVLYEDGCAHAAQP